MQGLTHEEESGAPVCVGRLGEVMVEVRCFVLVGGKEEVGGDGEIEVAIVEECRLPVNEPDALAVEEDVIRLEIHVARHHVGIETRVCGADLCRNWRRRRRFRFAGEEMRCGISR